jgi:hypothetical protein
MQGASGSRATERVEDARFPCGVASVDDTRLLGRLEHEGQTRAVADGNPVAASAA